MIPVLQRSGSKNQNQQAQAKFQMSNQPNSLQLQCYSCRTIINVPDQLVNKLMEVKQYSCPKCKKKQQLTISQESVRSVLQQSGQSFKPASMYYPSKQLASMNPVSNATQAGGDEGEEDEEEDDAGETFQDYLPRKLRIGATHPDPIVETSSLASVEPPDIAYNLQIQDVAEKNQLSALQLESITYACQQHEHFLPDKSRCGFFIGDGAGVGKGRTIAGLVLENWRQGRKKHLWISISSDLKFDSERDLKDIGAKNIKVHALNKCAYQPLKNLGITQGVIYSTYSSLIATSSTSRLTRFDQIVKWCGEDFDGLIVFDECHKAKNLIPDSAKKGEASKTGQAVVNIQNKLPNARVVYCSATGASEPRNLGYMVRLGLWGAGNTSFADFSQFLEAIQNRGVGALELVAMDLKIRGMYVCRTLSYKSTEFDIVEIDLDAKVKEQYKVASQFWAKLKGEFEKASNVVQELEPEKKQKKRQKKKNTEGSKQNFGSMMWRQFWATHQRFFRYVLMAAKVPKIVRMAQSALQQEKCVVIGLQSTGEARTADAVQEKGEEMDEFVSGPRELLLKLLDDYFPMPEIPGYYMVEGDSDEEIALQAGQNEPVERNQRRGRANQVNYCEQSDDDERQVKDELRETSNEETIDCEVDAPQKTNSAENGEMGETIQILDSDDEYDPNKIQSNESENEAKEIEEEEEEDDEVEEYEDDAGEIELSTETTSQLPNQIKKIEIDDEQKVIPSSNSNPSIGNNPIASSSSNSLSNGNLKRKFEPTFVPQGTNGKIGGPGQIINQLVQIKKKLKEEIQKLDLPLNPLDVLIDSLGGPQEVAELTGRKGRLIKYGNNIKYESRNKHLGSSLEMVNMEEKGYFMSGRKYIAVISDAASAGISLQADRREKNQRRRVHLTLELPWSADKAIQQFGRTHRANQASGPLYKIVFSNVGGEKRFAASVARRLESLGALTQGDRRAGPSLSQFNYGNKYGKRALSILYECVSENKDCDVVPPCCEEPEAVYHSPPQFYGYVRNWFCKVGLFKARCPLEHDNNDILETYLVSCDKSVKQDVSRFLNRLLGLEPNQQHCVFDFFIRIMEYTIKQAKREGEYVDGIFDIKGPRVTIEGTPITIFEDQVSKAPAVLYHVHMDKGVPFTEALQHHLENPTKDVDLTDNSAATNSKEIVDLATTPEDWVVVSPQKRVAEDQSQYNGFYRSKNIAIGRRYPVLLATYVSGTSPALFSIARPMTGFSQQRIPLWQLKQKYTQVGVDVAETYWNDQHEHAQKYCPGIRFKDYNIMAGLIMPVWGIISEEIQNARLRRDRQLRIFRVRTSDETKRFVGLFIPEDIKENLIQKITEHTGFFPRYFVSPEKSIKQIVEKQQKNSDGTSTDRNAEANSNGGNGNEIVWKNGVNRQLVFDDNSQAANQNGISKTEIIEID